MDGSIGRNHSSGKRGRDQTAKLYFLTIIASGTGMTPYEKYRGTALWDVLAKAISDLVENRDLVETTHRDYVVGYICESLQDQLSKPLPG